METVLALALGKKYTLILDENVESLLPALKDAGFKVIKPHKGMDDEEIKDLASTFAVLTANTADFLKDAKSYDYDVIDLDSAFIDNDPKRTNKTVQALLTALRATSLWSRRGNFHLKIHNDGSYTVNEIVV